MREWTEIRQCVVGRLWAGSVSASGCVALRWTSDLVGPGPPETADSEGLRADWQLGGSPSAAAADQRWNHLHCSRDWLHCVHFTHQVHSGWRRSLIDSQLVLVCSRSPGHFLRSGLRLRGVFILRLVSVSDWTNWGQSWLSQHCNSTVITAE